MNRLNRFAVRTIPTLLMLVMLLAGSVAWADEVFSKGGRRIAPQSYPITELRLVHEPGNLHYLQTYGGEYVLSDYWWREVKVGERVFSGYNPSPGVPQPGFPQPGPPPSQTSTRKVYVEIMSGRGFEFFQREDIEPVSFTLFEDLPREIQVRCGRLTTINLVAVFDGYHVQLGLQRPARVIPGYNGVPQSLGGGQGLSDITVAVYWEEDYQGGVRAYKSQGEVKSGRMQSQEATEDPEAWGQRIKAQVQGRAGSSSAQPRPMPQP